MPAGLSGPSQEHLRHRAAGCMCKSLSYTVRYSGVLSLCVSLKRLSLRVSKEQSCPKIFLLDVIS